MTLAEAIQGQRNHYQKYSMIRYRARTYYFKDRSLPVCCEICGYDYHVEIAHIKPICEFSLDTMLSEINDLANLKALCPNCHWELDHPPDSKK